MALAGHVATSATLASDPGPRGSGVPAGELTIMRRFFLLLGWLIPTAALVAEPGALIAPQHRITGAAAEWQDLASAFAVRRGIVADFEEHRVFPFRKTPVTLTGEVRVSREHGLSLHYLAPEERTVVLDSRGMLIRERGEDRALPSDPRANAANAALWHILQFDFAALGTAFDLYGEREGGTWALALVPREETVRRAIGEIFVTGRDANVREIELRRSPKQYIYIAIGAPRESGFSPEDLRRYFR
jgi:hypothetical protein